MIKHIKIFYTSLLVVLLLFSCQKDDTYTLKVYDPIGGFVDAETTVLSDEYLADNVQEIKLYMEVNRLKSGSTASFDVEIVSALPASLASAFELTNSSVTITNNDSLEHAIGQVDWSDFNSGDTLVVNFQIVDNENFDVTSLRRYATLTLIKNYAPVLDLGNVTLSRLFPLGSTDNITETFTFEVFDKPVEEAIDFPVVLSNTSGLVRGTHFDIDTLLHVNVGETTAEISMTSYNSAFATGQQGTFYFEAHSSNIPAGKTFTIGDNWWKGFKLGKQIDYIWLDKDVTYDVLMDTNWIGNQLISVTVEVSSSPVIQDIAIPFQLNEFNLQEGVHFDIPDKFIRVAEGGTEATIDVYVYNSAFANGESNSLWLEIYQADVPAGQYVSIDTDYWWTTFNVGKK